VADNEAPAHDPVVLPGFFGLKRHPGSTVGWRFAGEQENDALVVGAIERGNAVRLMRALV
jgi:hypothetical protein